MKQQSQTLFWLLLAATAAVDVVAVTWLLRAGPESRAAFLYDALVAGQFAVVCMWAAFAARRTWSAWLGVTIAVLVSTALDVRVTQLSVGEAFGIYGSFAAALMAALWTLQRTRLWYRLSGQRSAVWQFSIGQLLAVMTLVALLLTSLRGSELLFGKIDVWRFLLALTICDVLVVVLTIVLWASRWNLLMRLAVVCAAAGALGVILTALEVSGLLGQNVVSSFDYDLIPNVSYTIVISLVALAWLELGSIVPIDRRAESPPPAGAADA